jgi:chaperonin cofactor prefoldin
MSSFDYIDQLRKRIETLESRLKELTERYERFGKSFLGWDDLIKAHLKLLEKNQEYAFERIRNIEHKIFPKLADDICKLDDIIGPFTDEKGEPISPPRKRKPKPKA